MGVVIHSTKGGAANQPIAAPMTTEMSELMMRLRSSLRCSKKVIAPPGSSGGLVICVLDSDSGTDSGRMLVVIMRSFLGICDRRSFGIRIGRLFQRAPDGFGHL